MEIKIKEEVIKQLEAEYLKVIDYPDWLVNIIPVPKIWLQNVHWLEKVE